MAKLTIYNNGPILVEGEFTMCDSPGSAFDLSGRTTIYVCRCGHSEDKPFCDGAHRKMSFHSEVKARTLPPPGAKPA